MPPNSGKWFLVNIVPRFKELGAGFEAYTTFDPIGDERSNDPGGPLGVFARAPAGQQAGEKHQSAPQQQED
jgi:hypothetical protein